MNILVKFKPFKDSFFLQLFSANFMSVIGDTIYRITLVYSAFFLGGATNLGAVFASQTLTIFVTVLFAGSLTSFFRSKSILVLSVLIRALLSLFLLFLMINDVQLIYAFIILGIFFGLSESLFRPAYQELFKINVKKDLFEESVSLISLSRQTVNIIGPVIGGFLISFFSVEISVLIIFFSFLTSAFLIVNLNETKKKDNGNSKSNFSIVEVTREVREGILFVRNTKWLLFGMSIAFFSVPIQQALSTVVVPTFIFDLGGNEKLYSVLLSSYAVGALTGGFVFLHIGKKLRSIKIVISFLVFGYCMYSVLGFFQGTIEIVVIGFFIGVFFQLYSVSWENFTLLYVEERYIARTASVQWFVFNALAPISIALFSIIVEYVGGENIIRFAALFALIGIITISIIFRVGSLDFGNQGDRG